MNGVVFAVDRQQFAARRAQCRHQQTAGTDDGFLVGQQQALARPRGSQRRHQPGCANDGGEHGIDFRRLRDFGQRRGACTGLCCRATFTQRRAQGLLQRCIADDRHRRTEAQRQVGQGIDAGLGRQCMHAVAIGVARNDIERARTDRTGRAEQGDRPHHVAQFQNNAAAGSSASIASSRS